MGLLGELKARVAELARLLSPEELIDVLVEATRRYGVHELGELRRLAQRAFMAMAREEACIICGGGRA